MILAAIDRSLGIDLNVAIRNVKQGGSTKVQIERVSPMLLPSDLVNMQSCRAVVSDAVHRAVVLLDCHPRTGQSWRMSRYNGGSSPYCSPLST